MVADYIARRSAKAKQNGLAVSDSMSDADVWQLIFARILYRKVVTDVPGRGVGMDVVKRNITQMGGGWILNRHADLVLRLRFPCL